MNVLLDSPQPSVRNEAGHCSKELYLAEKISLSPFISKPLPPPIIGYPPIFRILLAPPPPPTSQHLRLSLTVPKYVTSICIKPCYDHLMKAIEELWFQV